MRQIYVPRSLIIESEINRKMLFVDTIDVIMPVLSRNYHEN
jgi:hypothetical protein